MAAERRARQLSASGGPHADKRRRETSERTGTLESLIDSPRALQHALAQSSGGGLAQIQRLISEAPIGILVADDRARYVSVNESACRLTGYRESELLKMALPDLTAVTDVSVADRLWKAFIDQGRQRGEFAIRRRDGSTLVVQYEALANVAPGLHVTFLRRLHSGSS